MGAKIIVYLFLAFISISSSKKTYEGYKVFSVVPKCETDVRILKSFKENAVGVFWEDHFDINHVVKIMVHKDNQEEFLDTLQLNNIESKEVIPDVSKMIEEQLHPKLSTRDDALYSMTWDRYHNLEEINNWLDELKAAYPNIVETVVMGQSVENRDIKGVKINFNPGQTNLIGMFEGTIHAREWIATATVTWVIKEFLTSTDPEVRALAENFEWHIFPVVNPDGYSYTFTDDRLWRKNRNVQNETCPGIDLNRNFGHMWMNVGATDDNCDNTYAGPSAFSEPESSAIAQYVTNLKDQGSMIYYISFHSYSQLVLVPYSHLSEEDVLTASNYGDMYEIGVRGAAKLAERHGTVYRTGIAASVLYPMSGTSFDWVKAETDVPVSYLIELRDTGDYGFLLPVDQIIPNNLEVMDMILEMDRTTRQLRYYYSGSNEIFSFSLLIIVCAIFVIS